jgi:uncharacterized protein YjbI with pentapeptide repeats
VLLAIAFAVAVCASAGSAAQPQPLSRQQQLEQEKLRQEIEQIRIDNRNAVGVRGFFSTNAGLLTGIAAIGAALTALFNLTRQRGFDREQRTLESTRRLDERFSAILADLGDESDAVQAAAAVSLLTFLRPELAEYHHQVRLVTLANLKVREEGTISSLLVGVFEEALRTDVELTATEVDLTDAVLTGADLSGLDLHLAKLTGAKLRGAQLDNVNLRGAQGQNVILENASLRGSEADLQEVRFQNATAAGAIFHEANLGSAKFQEADLERARFQSARLQSAHFERANLSGARFQQADVNDAFFTEAILDESALKTLIDARNYRKAHFSPDVFEQLCALDEERQTKNVPDPDPEGATPGTS